MLDVFEHFCFIDFMKYMSCLTSIFAIIILMFFEACTPSENIDEIYNQLNDNQAKVIYKIDGKEFYTSQSIFSGEVNVSDQLLSVTLADQFQNQTIISFGGDKWYSPLPSKKEIFADNQVNAGVKMGKLVDREKMVGEGYMMSEGSVTLIEFSKDKIVLKIYGKVGKYSDFQQPSEYYNVEGTVVCRKPLFRLANITEKDLFSGLKTSTR
ncbi:hypothetical protein [Dyadobacter diqingensis]|uniref:hypothetical protein n=1 Tax=Dyadobacter diqingensis TaxID=2938121 RepID=UPI0020C18AB5|nr:hypothetical protein [Dyadobacter diqingensis]